MITKLFGVIWLKNYKSVAVVLVGDFCPTVISVPRRVEACVEATKRTLHKRYPKWTDRRINDRAWAICQDLENRGKLKDSANMSNIAEVDCHKIAGDTPSNYAIPRLKALPYKSSSGPNAACVRNALARFNQVKGATSAEKASAKRKLLAAAEKLGIKTKGQSEMFKPEMFFVESKIVKMQSMTEAVAWLGENVTLTPFAESLLESEKSTDNSGVTTFIGSSGYTTSGLPLDGTNYALSESPTVDPTPTHILIAGTAISSGTTMNLNTYLREELEKAAPSLAGKPIQLDHSHKSEDNIGKVLASSCDPDRETIKYIGRIREGHAVTPAISLGDIDTVSVGGYAKKVKCNICGESKLPDSAGRIACNHRLGRVYEGKQATAIGIDILFVELSVTPIPADPRASAGVITHDSIQSALVALAESYIGADSSVSEEIDHSVSLVEKDTQIETLRAELKASQTRERTRLAEGIAEAEVKMGVTALKEKSNRVTSLSEKTIETLEEVKSTIDRQLELFMRRQDDEPTSRGKTIEESPGVANELTWGETKAVVREILFGFGPPSASAKRSTSEMVSDTDFGQHRAYKEMFAKQEGGRIE